jgi:hypothetical protein
LNLDFSKNPKVYTDNPNWEIYVALAYMMMHLNHVINFFFYCLIGPKFRSEVKKLLPKWCVKESSIRPLRQSSKSRNIITYPSTTYKKTPTQSNKQVTNELEKNNMKPKHQHLELMTRTDDLIKKIYLISTKVEQKEIVLIKMNRHNVI